jgi:hypothetical protein
METMQPEHAPTIGVTGRCVLPALAWRRHGFDAERR